MAYFHVALLFHVFDEVFECVGMAASKVVELLQSRHCQEFGHRYAVLDQKLKERLEVQVKQVSFSYTAENDTKKVEWSAYPRCTHYASSWPYLYEIHSVHNERVHHGIFQRAFLPILTTAENQASGDVDAVPMQRQRQLVRRAEIRPLQQRR